MPGTPATCEDSTYKIIFDQSYMRSMHTWSIVKAVELLRVDGYVCQADLLETYLLPILEGAVFCDTWGDSDFDGSQILHYYCPHNPQENFGYGASVPGLNIMFAHPSWEYAKHPFYGYGNAAEYAQNRYEAAKRAYSSQWGTLPQDHMAGWIVDKWFGQDDPISGKYASGVEEIDAQQRFGCGQTPRTALTDLLENHSQSQVIFPRYSNRFLSEIILPKPEVFQQAPEWFDEHFEGADDIETYNGYDGHGKVCYAAWTRDHESPLIFYVPEHSREHAFFLLGWSLHLVVDCACPAHTDNDSTWIALGHHSRLDGHPEYVIGGAVTDWGTTLKDSLPALTATQFLTLYRWPPNFSGLPSSFLNKVQSLDPSQYYKERWYSSMSAGQYAIELAQTAHGFMPFLKALTIASTPLSIDYLDWNVIGFVTALWMDLAIKAAAGVMLNFLNEAGYLAESEQASIRVRDIAKIPEISLRSLLGDSADERISLRNKGYPLILSSMHVEQKQARLLLKRIKCLAAASPFGDDIKIFVEGDLKAGEFGIDGGQAHDLNLDIAFADYATVIFFEDKDFGGRIGIDANLAGQGPQTWEVRIKSDGIYQLEFEVVD